MPEAITYNDFRRRLVALFPVRTPIELHVFQQAFGRARGEQGLEGERVVGWNMQLADGAFCNSGLKDCYLDPDQIYNHGNSILFILRAYADADGFEYRLWLRVRCYLNGHVVPLTEEEAFRAVTDRDNNRPLSLAVLKNNLDDTHKAKFNCHHSVGILDRNKLTKLEFIQLPTSQDLREPGHDHFAGYCTLTQYEQWASDVMTTHKWSGNLEVSIYRYLQDKGGVSKFWGIGTSHASEILHLAEENPATKARVILTNPDRCWNFIQAVRKFYDWGTSAEYFRFVPARSSGPWYKESPLVTNWINSRFYRVVGKTRPTQGCLLSYGHYSDLVNRGKLVDGTSAKRGVWKVKVPVYAQSHVGARGTAFTIFPLGSAADRGDELVGVLGGAVQLSAEEAASHALSSKSGRAQLGIASFMDNKEAEREERECKKRRWPYRDGSVGRPKLVRTMAGPKVEGG